MKKKPDITVYQLIDFRKKATASGLTFSAVDEDGWFTVTGVSSGTSIKGRYLTGSEVTPNGHSYALIFERQLLIDNSVYIQVTTGSFCNSEGISTPASDFRLRVRALATTAGLEFNARIFLMLIDLTATFGEGQEPKTITEMCERLGYTRDTLPYYPYNPVP